MKISQKEHNDPSKKVAKNPKNEKTKVTHTDIFEFADTIFSQWWKFIFQ